MPLFDVEFQAGITTILEAMSMCRAVVCTRTAGQTDTIVEGETGTYVPPRDALALRESLERLLGEPDFARSMGESAREWVIEHAGVERYADRLCREVGSLRKTQ
jgi:glycosyltransferase involved in cell wall biosynthesis